MRIIVIGSIASGVSAAMRIAAGERNVNIAVYEKSGFYSCGGMGLPHYLTVSNEELASAIDEKVAELKAQGIESHPGCLVTSVDSAKRTITYTEVSSGRAGTDTYDRLVIAMGCSTPIPAVPGSGRVGVQVLKSVEDLIFLKEYTRTPYVRDIVILGGSYEGIEVAKAFMKMGRKVRIIEKERRLLTDLDPEVSDMIKRELEAQGALINLGESAVGFPGQTFIEQVKTGRSTYPCDLCIVCTGTVPNSALAASAGVAVTPGGAIKVNTALETNIPGIYAVGGCTDLVGANLRTCSLRTEGFEVARTGLTEEEARKKGVRVKTVTAQGKDRPGICPGANTINIKLVYEAGSRRVLGAQLWGAKNVTMRANVIAVAIAAGMTADELSQVELAYSSANSTIWDPVQIVCSMAV